MTRKEPRILVYGYGNPGRQDDGAGVLLAEKLEQWLKESNLEQVNTDFNYQLNLEDAAGIAEYDLVIFADASRDNVGTFRMEPLVASDRVEFTMHAVSPAFILHLAREVFDREPEAYLLHIRGYEWEFMKDMTPEALKNLEGAAGFLKKKILEYKKK